MKLKDLLVEFDTGAVAAGVTIKKRAMKQDTSMGTAKKIGVYVLGRRVEFYNLDSAKPKQIAYAGAEFKGDQCNGSVRVTFSDGSKLSFMVDGLTDDWSDMKDNSTISGIKGTVKVSKESFESFDGTTNKENSFVVTFDSPVMFKVTGDTLCSYED